MTTAVDEFSNYKVPPAQEAPPGWFWVFEDESWVLYRRGTKPMDPMVWVRPNGRAKGEHSWVLIRRGLRLRLDSCPARMLDGVEETIEAAVKAAEKAVTLG